MADTLTSDGDKAPHGQYGKGPDDPHVKGPDNPHVKGPGGQGVKGPDGRSVEGPGAEGVEGRDDHDVKGPGGHDVKGSGGLGGQGVKGAGGQGVKGAGGQGVKGPNENDVKGPGGHDVKGPGDQGVKRPDDHDVKGPDGRSVEGSGDQDVKGPDGQGDKESTTSDDKEEEDFTDESLETLRTSWDKCKDLLVITKIFKYLDVEKRENLARSLKVVEFYDGQIIVKKGDMANAFFIIDDGMAAVYDETENEVPVILQTLKQGDHVGAVGLYSKRPHRGTVKANGTVKCARMSEETFRQVLEPFVDLLMVQYQSFTSLLV